MIKEIDTGEIVYSCKDPDVCVSAAQASRESDAWFVHVYRCDRQMVSIYYVGERDKLKDLCRYLFSWAGGVPEVSDECKLETLAELSADLRRLCDKWIEDKAMVKMECLGLIAGQIADRIDAAAKRGRRLLKSCARWIFTHDIHGCMAKDLLAECAAVLNDDGRFLFEQGGCDGK